MNPNLNSSQVENSPQRNKLTIQRNKPAATKTTRKRTAQTHNKPKPTTNKQRQPNKLYARTYCYFRDHLDSIKARLANIIEIPDDMLVALNNYLLMVINTRLLTSKLVLTAIKPVKKYLTKFVDDYSRQYLESVHLVPPPKI